MANSTRDIMHYTSGNFTGYVSGSAADLNKSCSGSKWAGAEGSSAYTVGDIVTALKRIGVLAQ